MKNNLELFLSWVNKRIFDYVKTSRGRGARMVMQSHLLDQEERMRTQVRDSASPKFFIFQLKQIHSRKKDVRIASIDKSQVRIR